jgi:hypothetical protein
METKLNKIEIENYIFNNYSKEEKVEEVCNLLLKITFQSDEPKWVQDLCLRLIDLYDLNVSGLAITCLGHLARIHRDIEKEAVLKKLYDNLENEIIGDRVQDAIDDIEIY